MPVTQAQIFTLRRMRSGTSYIVRGDGARGLEVRVTPGTCQRDDINCSSLMPLMRKGLIEFVGEPLVKTRYYDVRLTERGASLAGEPTNEQ